jgi:Sir2- and TIR-associating SLOG family/SIR2-like domain
VTEQSKKFSNFYKEYGKALDNREAALFVGAGLSMPAGFKSWQELLREVAIELQLDIDRETDLVALAQFHVNERRVRTKLNQLLVDEYNRDLKSTPNHMLIASLSIDTVWTTNYDQLLEHGFREAGKRCDVKVTTENFATTLRGKDVTVYKMHGDVTRPHEAVIIKEDYELYNVHREVFTTALRGDLVSKTFLFLGFSFTDTNIDYILSRIRVLLGNNPRQHYCIMKYPTKTSGDASTQATYDYKMRWLELRISDLKRYGIEALMINDYSEITDILHNLNKRANRNNIFVSGSTVSGGSVLDQRAETLANKIGREAINRNFNVVSGFGLGVGNAFLLGAMEVAYRDREKYLLDRIILRPFPQLPRDTPQRKELYSAYRHNMLSSAGTIIFLGGAKLDEHGEVQIGSGVLEEFEIATKLGKYPIPIGSTGRAAKVIWERVVAEPTQYFLNRDVKKYLQVLGDETKSDEEIIAAIFDLINRIHE